MSDLISVTKDGETLPVHPSLLDAHFGLGWVLSAQAKAPAPLDHDGDGRKGGSLPTGGEPQAAVTGTDSGDQFSDEQLREIITKAMGKAPHHKLGRDKLIAQFNELNAKADEAK
jgi:hypothetical protein